MSMQRCYICVCAGSSIALLREALPSMDAARRAKASSLDQTVQINVSSVDDGVDPNTQSPTRLLH